MALPVILSKGRFPRLQTFTLRHQPKQHLTDAIADFPPPLFQKELKSCLGLAGFYSAFIQDFATIMHPLTKLASDNVQFVWWNDCESAFHEIKQQLTANLILAFPSLNKTFIIKVDPS